MRTINLPLVVWQQTVTKMRHLQLAQTFSPSSTSSTVLNMLNSELKLWCFPNCCMLLTDYCQLSQVASSLKIYYASAELQCQLKRCVRSSLRVSAVSLKDHESQIYTHKLYNAGIRDTLVCISGIVLPRSCAHFIATNSFLSWDFQGQRCLIL